MAFAHPLPSPSTPLAVLSLLLAASLLAPAAPSTVTLRPCPDHGFLPDAVTSPNGTVHLVFHRGEPGASDLHHTTWSPETRAFSDPVRVNSIPGAGLAAGTVRGAHLALGKGDTIHIAWMGSSRTAPEGDHARVPMCYTRSLDGGRSFEPQRNLVTSAFGLDGGGTLAADRRGNVHVVWHASGDEEGADQRRVVVATSRDNGETFAPEFTLDTGRSGVCPCCGIRAVASPRGEECFVLFRGAPQPDQRGIQLFSFDPARSAPRLVHNDPWIIQTCPVSSGSFAFSPTHLAVAWETDYRATVGVIDLPTGKVTRSITAPASPGNAHQKHPSVALADDGSLLLAWLAVKGWGQPGTLHWQHFDPAGQPTELAGAKNLQVPWTRPAITAIPSGYQIFH